MFSLHSQQSARTTFQRQNQAMARMYICFTPLPFSLAGDLKHNMLVWMITGDQLIRQYEMICHFLEGHKKEK